MPRVMRHLIEKAEETGKWNPKYAEEQCLREVGENRGEKIVDFLAALKTITPDHKVTSEIMREVSTELGMKFDLHQTIGRLNTCGIINGPARAFFR